MSFLTLLRPRAGQNAVHFLALRAYFVLSESSHPVFQEIRGVKYDFRGFTSYFDQKRPDFSSKKGVRQLFPASTPRALLANQNVRREQLYIFLFCHMVLHKRHLIIFCQLQQIHDQLQFFFSGCEFLRRMCIAAQVEFASHLFGDPVRP